MKNPNLVFPDVEFHVTFVALSIAKLQKVFCSKTF